MNQEPAILQLTQKYAMHSTLMSSLTYATALRRPSSVGVGGGGEARRGR